MSLALLPSPLRLSCSTGVARACQRPLRSAGVLTLAARKPPGAASGAGKPAHEQPRGFGGAPKQPIHKVPLHEQSPEQVDLQQSAQRALERRAKQLPNHAIVGSSFKELELFQTALFDYGALPATLGPRDEACDAVSRAAVAFVQQAAGILWGIEEIRRVSPGTSSGRVAEYLVVAYMAVASWPLPSHPGPSAQQCWLAARRIWIKHCGGDSASPEPMFKDLMQVYVRAWERADAEGGDIMGLPAKEVETGVQCLCSTLKIVGDSNLIFIGTRLLAVLRLRECMQAVAGGAVHPAALLPLFHCNQLIIDAVFTDTLVAAGGAVAVGDELLSMVPVAGSASAAEADYFLLCVSHLLLSSGTAVPTVVPNALLAAVPITCSMLIQLGEAGAIKAVKQLVDALMRTGRPTAASEVLWVVLTSIHASTKSQQACISHFACAALATTCGSLTESGSRVNLPELSTLLERLLSHPPPDRPAASLVDALGPVLMERLDWLLPRIAEAEATLGGATLLGPLTCAALLAGPVSRALEPPAPADAGVVADSEQPLAAPGHSNVPPSSAPPAVGKAVLAQYLSCCPAAACQALLDAAANDFQHGRAAFAVQQLCRRRGMAEPAALAARLLTAAVGHSAPQALNQLRHRQLCGDFSAVALLLSPPSLASLVESCLAADQLADAHRVLAYMPDQRLSARQVLQALSKATPAAACAAAAEVCPMAARCACKHGDGTLLRSALQAAEQHGALQDTQAVLRKTPARLAAALTLLFTPPASTATASTSSSKPSPARRLQPAASGPALCAPASAVGLALLRGGTMPPSTAVLSLVSQPALHGMCQALLDASLLDAAAVVCVQLLDTTARGQWLRSVCQAVAAAPTQAASDAELASGRLLSAAVFQAQEHGTDASLLPAALEAAERHGMALGVLAAVSAESAAGCATALVRGGHSGEALRWVEHLLPPQLAVASGHAAARAVSALRPAFVSADGVQVMLAAHATAGDASDQLQWDAAAAAMVLGAAVPDGMQLLQRVLAGTTIQPPAVTTPAAALATYLRFFQRLEGPDNAPAPMAAAAAFRPQLVAMLDALVHHHSGGGQQWPHSLPGPALQLVVELSFAQGWHDVARQLWRQRDRGCVVRLGDSLALKLLVVAAGKGDVQSGVDLIEGQLPKGFKKGSRQGNPDAYAAYAAVLAMSGNTKAAWQELQTLHPSSAGSAVMDLQLVAAEALLDAWTPKGGGAKEAQLAYQLYVAMLDGTHAAGQPSFRVRVGGPALPPASLTTVAVMLAACQRNQELRRLCDARLALDLGAFALPPGGSAGQADSASKLQVVALDVVRWYSLRGQHGAVAAALFVLPADAGTAQTFVKALDADVENVVDICRRALRGQPVGAPSPLAAEGGQVEALADTEALRRGRQAVEAAADAWLQAGGAGGRGKGSPGASTGAGLGLNQLLERELKSAFSEDLP